MNMIHFYQKFLKLSKDRWVFLLNNMRISFTPVSRLPCSIKAYVRCISRNPDYGFPLGHHKTYSLVSAWLTDPVCYEELSFIQNLTHVTGLWSLFFVFTLVFSTWVCFLGRLSWLRWSSHTACARVWWGSETRSSGRRRDWGPASGISSELWVPGSELTDTESKAWRSR